jgi:FkbM family methyltransferase
MAVESVRRVIRRIVRYDSWIYRTAARWVDAIAIVTREGFGVYSVLRRLRGDADRSATPVPLTLRNLRFPILLRPGTRDAETVISSVVRKEYGQVELATDPQWMVDAGAYIGDTAAFFLSRYPNLKVIALEPNPPSHAMAAENLRPYADRAVLLKKGLWSADQTLRLAGDSTGMSVSDAGFEIECVSIPRLLQEFAIPRLNILKMDIEGAEEQIFSSKPEQWLDRVDLILMEIHGASIEALISRVLSERGFLMRQFRSVWYCERR